MVDTPTLLAWWLLAFAISLALELPVYALLTREYVSLRRALLAATACTALTHPLLWFAWPRVVSDYAWYTISGELLVASAESVLFFALARRVPLLRAVGASFLANGLSYGAGVVLAWLGLM